MGYPRLLRIRRQETIDCAHVMTGRFLDGIIFHLHFIPAPQIDAAVGVRGAVDLDVQFKVLEFPVRGDVRARGLVEQAAVLHDPTGSFCGIVKGPPREVISVEQRSWFTLAEG